MPVLPPHQDPAGLEARVAFHLHRLALTGTSLTNIGFDRTDAADLAAGRTRLTLGKVHSLARRLGVSGNDLVRPLTTDEMADWTFYQHSARGGVLVWERALAYAREHRLTHHKFAQTIKVDDSLVRRVLTGKQRLIFTRRMAVALTQAVGGEPEEFLPEPPLRT